MSAARTLDALRMCLSRHDLLRPEVVLVAAVSGGSDSMALLNGLSLLRQETGFTPAPAMCSMASGARIPLRTNALYGTFAG